MPSPEVTVAIVAAGGRGERLRAGVPKQLLSLAGRTILEWSVDAFLACPLVSEVVVVLPADLVAAAERFGWHAAPKPVRIVIGGARRQDSVAAGAAAAADRTEVFVIHDAARPFVTGTVIERTIEAAREHGAAVAALRASDTVKRAAREAPFVIAATIPRDEVWLAQTPQAFRRDVLEAALALGATGVEATDEAVLAELAGHPVRLVEGDPRNIKITTASDLETARAWIEAGRGAQEQMHIGLGYDLHRFASGRRLVLGGITIPSERGLEGHSDADAVCHAVTDAILGAAAIGDIGRLFPDTAPEWKDASSLDLLRRAMAAVGEAGYAVSNVDVVVIAERPKIGPHVQAMRESLAGALRITPADVSIKGKTNEGVDAVGRGEALAVHAVAALRPWSVDPAGHAHS